MQGYNCIMVFNHEKTKLLFCKRTKNPYRDLYNLVGGKIDKGEGGNEAAYRELKEETGIDSQSIQLYHMMDFKYYNHDSFVEVYVGYLNTDVKLCEEINPLEWIDVNDNFFDCSKYAGEGNIGHMVEQVKHFNIGIKANQNKSSKKSLSK